MNTLIKSVLTTRAGYGLTLLRVVVGIAFIATAARNYLVRLAATAWKARRSTWKAWA